MMFLLTKSECAVSEDIYLHPTSIHGQSLAIPKYQEEGALKEKTSMWGMNLFLKKTMSKKSLIAKYALKNILPGNANFQNIL